MRLFFKISVVMSLILFFFYDQHLEVLNKLEHFLEYSDKNLRETQKNLELSDAIEDEKIVNQKLINDRAYLKDLEFFYSMLFNEMNSTILDDNGDVQSILSWCSRFEQLISSNMSPEKINQKNLLREFLFSKKEESFNNYVLLFKKIQKENDALDDNEDDPFGEEEKTVGIKKEFPKINLIGEVGSSDLKRSYASISETSNQGAHNIGIDAIRSFEVLNRHLNLIAVSKIKIHLVGEIIKNTWIPQHKDDFGYPLSEGLRKAKDSYVSWFKNIEKGVLLDQVIEAEKNKQDSSLGKWLPSQFVKTFRENWPFFDEKIALIAQKHEKIHDQLGHLLTLNIKRRRDYLMKEMAVLNSELEQLFIDISREEELFLLKKAKTERTINGEFNTLKIALFSEINHFNYQLKKNMELTKTKIEEINVMINESDQKVGAINGQYKVQQAEMLESSKKIKNEQVDFRSTISSIFNRNIFIVILLSSFITLSLSYNLSKISFNIRSLSKGDLLGKLKIYSLDELRYLAKDINYFKNNLVSFFVDLNERTHSLGLNSKMLNEISNEINGGAIMLKNKSALAEQACGKLEMTVGEIKSTSSIVDEEIKNVSTVLTDVNSSFKGLEELMENSHQKITNDTKKTSESGLLVQKLEEASVFIGEVTDVIHKLSEKSKVLALNAKIEATRAGEQGSGFNVIANEIQKLSNETNAATQKIDSEIASIQKFVKLVASTFIDIIENSKNTTDSFSECLKRINEQSVQITNCDYQLQKTMASIQGIDDKISNAGNELSGISELVLLTSESVNEFLRSTSKLVDMSMELQSSSTKVKDSLKNYRIAN